MYTTSLRQVTRIGVYGVTIQNDSVLLTTKGQAGCYRGLLDLPGGGIEFAETQEAALRREYKEEVAMTFERMELLDNYTSVLTFDDTQGPFVFHHIGQVYMLHNVTSIPEGIPEDPFAWYSLHELRADQLTPFAKAALKAYASG